eukprot:ctg_1240.g413
MERGIHQFDVVGEVWVQHVGLGLEMRTSKRALSWLSGIHPTPHRQPRRPPTTASRAICAGGTVSWTRCNTPKRCQRNIPRWKRAFTSWRAEHRGGKADPQSPTGSEAREAAPESRLRDVDPSAPRVSDTAGSGDDGASLGLLHRPLPFAEQLDRALNSPDVTAAQRRVAHDTGTCGGDHLGRFRGGVPAAVLLPKPGPAVPAEKGHADRLCEHRAAFRGAAPLTGRLRVWLCASAAGHSHPAAGAVGGGGYLSQLLSRACRYRLRRVQVAHRADCVCRGQHHLGHQWRKLASVKRVLIYDAEHAVNPQFQTYFDALYFSIVALTTVGLGDVAPRTPLGKLVISVAILVGVAVIPFQLGQLGRALFAQSSTSSEADAANEDEDDSRRPLRMARVACPRCGARGHLIDARYCRICAERLASSDNGTARADGAPAAGQAAPTRAPDNL